MEYTKQIALKVEVRGDDERQGYQNLMIAIREGENELFEK